MHWQIAVKFTALNSSLDLSYRYSNCKQKEIGAILGLEYSTVSQSRARLKTKNTLLLICRLPA
jgi:hypothetical protein